MEQLLQVVIAAGLSGIVSAIATVAAIKVELRALRRDVDRHEQYFLEARRRHALHRFLAALPRSQAAVVAAFAAGAHESRRV